MRCRASARYRCRRECRRKRRAFRRLNCRASARCRCRTPSWGRWCACWSSGGHDDRDSPPCRHEGRSARAIFHSDLNECRAARAATSEGADGHLRQVARDRQRVHEIAARARGKSRHDDTSILERRSRYWYRHRGRVRAAVQLNYRGRAARRCNGWNVPRAHARRSGRDRSLVVCDLHFETVISLAEWKCCH